MICFSSCYDILWGQTQQLEPSQAVGGFTRLLRCFSPMEISVRMPQIWGSGSERKWGRRGGGGGRGRFPALWKYPGRPGQNVSEPSSHSRKASVQCQPEPTTDSVLSSTVLWQESSWKAHPLGHRTWCILLQPHGLESIINIRRACLLRLWQSWLHHRLGICLGLSAHWIG